MLTITINCKNSIQAAELIYKINSSLYGCGGSKSMANANVSVDDPDSTGKFVVLRIGKKSHPDFEICTKLTGEVVSNG